MRALDGTEASAGGARGHHPRRPRRSCPAAWWRLAPAPPPAPLPHTHTHTHTHTRTPPPDDADQYQPQPRANQNASTSLFNSISINSFNDMVTSNPPPAHPPPFPPFSLSFSLFSTLPPRPPFLFCFAPGGNAFISKFQPLFQLYHFFVAPPPPPFPPLLLLFER